MENNKYIKVADWCSNSKMDYMTLIRILKQSKVNLIRIGVDLFVENENQIESAINLYMAAKIYRINKLREQAKEKAATRRFQTDLVRSIFAAGGNITPEIEAKIKTKYKEGGMI